MFDYTIGRRYFVIAGLLMGLASSILSSCTPALPERGNKSLDRQRQNHNEASDPNNSASDSNTICDSERNAQEAREALAKVDHLMKEARTLTGRAEAAHKQCQAIVKTIPKKPKIKIVYKEPEKPSDTSSATGDPHNPHGGSPSTTTQTPNPEFSPSDAP